MKKLVYCFVLPLLILSSACRKNHCSSYQSAGKITGIDYTLCACCGGYFIIIDGKQYRFDTLPTGSTINIEKEHLPVAIFLNWHVKPGACGSDMIVIDAVSR